MREFILVLVVSVLILGSCVRFGILTPTTQSSSLSDKEISFGVGNYSRAISFEVRKGIFNDGFMGSDVGLFISYSLPDSYFKSISLFSDIKVSFFEHSRSKIASGIGFSYLNIFENIENVEYHFDSFYVVFPLYMESSLTEWFRFMVNFRLFNSILDKGVYNQKLHSYKNLFLTLNLGILFFQTLSIEGYMLAGENFESFPIPGFSLKYLIKF
ncbi:MAG: hypothetical protein ACK4F9_01395 [Brevinematia bacterium]